MAMSGLTQPPPDPVPDGAEGDEDATPGSADHEERQPRSLRALPLRLEEATELDPIVDRADEVVAPLLGGPDVKALLGGRWLGHAVHPLLTDLPIGFWTSATTLDLVGGRRSADAARRLVGFGVLSALPTAATGWSDWLSLDRPLRRVGVVHAGANTAALGLYAFSWMARRKGQRAVGVLLGLMGAAAASGAGHLGGHMTVGRGAGVLATEDARGPARPNS
jgi:uncharacterized membrane protein